MLVLSGLVARAGLVLFVLDFLFCFVTGFVLVGLVGLAHLVPAGFVGLAGLPDLVLAGLDAILSKFVLRWGEMARFKV